jgi:hypothetical protein
LKFILGFKSFFFNGFTLGFNVIVLSVVGDVLVASQASAVTSLRLRFVTLVGNIVGSQLLWCLHQWISLLLAVSIMIL